MKICLIGSTRFMTGYHDLNRLLTLAGYVVYTVAMVNSAERGTAGPNIPAEDKETLDLVHLLKIQESDAVCLVTNKEGYVGNSTRREIKWAAMSNKQFYKPGDKLLPNVRYYDPDPKTDFEHIIVIPSYEE